MRGEGRKKRAKILVTRRSDICHHPIMTHMSSPPPPPQLVPSTSQLSASPSQATTESQATTRMDTCFHLLKSKIPPPCEDEKFIIFQSQLESPVSRTCAKCWGTKTMKASNNSFDISINVMCFTCSDSDTPVTPHHLVDAGKEKDLTELNCKLSLMGLSSCLVLRGCLFSWKSSLAYQLREIMLSSSPIAIK
ncbi:hypothetical protein E2C01_032770 [Portunus trituberculatus]|uniref:Uncharacterized protein n=1 Tax=Portunus trituberculatus TaxID=210409 RepID=A0A5B7EW43_PORTR|nr:hypothetical protein [Portunus trituberculatus]